MTNHYTGGGDSPAWIESSAGTWTRYVAGPGGGLVSVTNTGAVELQLANLHSDIVATATTASTGPASYSETTEYGLPRDPTATNRRYGWLGAHQRNTGDTLAQITLMGVRLYNPVTGRFLSVDPVPGGSCNAYDYVCADPVNGLDLDGKRSCGWCRKALKYTAVTAGVVGALACGASVVCGVAVGLASAAAAYAASNAGTRQWSWSRFGLTTARGGLFGGAHAGVGRYLGHTMKNWRFGVTWNKKASARGTDFYWRGARKFGIHSHRIRNMSRMKFVHYHHRGRGGIKRHRPWE